MTTALDSSVLLEVLTPNSPGHDLAVTALVTAVGNGPVLVCECVLAEIAPQLVDTSPAEFLADWHLDYAPGSLEIAALAGKWYAQHLARGGRGGRIVSDFLIGAHALVFAGRLLTRDHGYHRDYFRGLEVITP